MDPIASVAARPAEVNEKLRASFRFDEACHRLYHFFWGDLCDWYLELTKPALSGDAPRPFVGEVLVEVLEESLRLLHPVMPFLTEELWQRLPGVRERHGETITLAPYPQGSERRRDLELEGSMGTLFDVIGRVRNLRAELDVPPRTKLTLYLQSDDTDLSAMFDRQRALLKFLAGLESLELAAAPDSAARDRVGGALLGVVAPQRDLGAEQRERLEKEAKRLGDLIRQAQGQLTNQQFLEKAPAQVVEAKRDKLRELEGRLATVEAGL